MKIRQHRSKKPSITPEDIAAMEHCQRELTIASERMTQFLALLAKPSKPNLHVVRHHA